jgi:hypothetical protein
MTKLDGMDTVQRGVLRVCCADPRNLVPEQLTPSLLVKVCRDCGARHFEANAEPGGYGLRGN